MATVLFHGTLMKVDKVYTENITLLKFKDNIWKIMKKIFSELQRKLRFIKKQRILQ